MTKPRDGVRLTSVRIQNFRVLKDVSFSDLSPLTVLFGPNGAGKSTVLEALRFLQDAFVLDADRAASIRGGLPLSAEAGPLRSDEAITIEIGYCAEGGSEASYRYTLQTARFHERAHVVGERLVRTGPGGERTLLDRNPAHTVAWDESDGKPWEESLSDDAVPAAATLGNLGRHPELGLLREWVRSWRFFALDPASALRIRPNGASKTLSDDGGNIASVVLYLSTQQRDTWNRIQQTVRRMVPRHDAVTAKQLGDGTVSLFVKDREFTREFLADRASTGTLRLLMLLVALEEASEAGLIAIEEPENQLHPQLMARLVELARSIAARPSVVMTTHSPEVANALDPRELWLIARGEDGFAHATRAAETQSIPQLIEAGGVLGDLWMEGFFPAGDPITSADDRPWS